MKSFSISFQETNYSRVEVLASSYDEAVEAAIEQYNDGNVIWGKSDYEVLHESLKLKMPADLGVCQEKR